MENKDIYKDQTKMYVFSMVFSIYLTIYLLNVEIFKYVREDYQTHRASQIAELDQATWYHPPRLLSFPTLRPASFTAYP